MRGAWVAALVHAGAVMATPASVVPVAEMTHTQADNVLRTGARVSLRLNEELTTKNKLPRVGQRIQLEVAEPVMVNGVAVIPLGSPAIGEITEVRDKGMWGQSGYIGARLLHVRANGRQIRLSGQFNDKGITGTGGVVAAIAVLPVAGFFTTGTSAVVPVGAAVVGFVDEDVPFQSAAAAPAVMQVAPPQD